MLVPIAICRNGQTAAVISGANARRKEMRGARTLLHAANAKIPAWNRLQAQRSSTQIVRIPKQRIAARIPAARFIEPTPAQPLRWQALRRGALTPADAGKSN